MTLPESIPGGPLPIGTAHTERASGARTFGPAVAPERRPARAAFHLLLMASLPFPLVGFLSWALAAAGLGGLARDRERRRAAVVGLSVLAVAVAGGLVLGGTVRGIPFSGPESPFLKTGAPVGAVLAATFASLGLLLAGGTSRARLARAAAALTLGGYLAFLGVVYREKVLRLPSAAIPDALFLAPLLAGIGLTFFLLLLEALGSLGLRTTLREVE